MRLALEHIKSLERGAVSEQVGIHHGTDENKQELETEDDMVEVLAVIYSHRLAGMEKSSDDLNGISHGDTEAFPDD